MKDQILKIAKVKSEKEFYKKYPTEEAFMAKHGKQLRKAAMGTKMVDTQLTQLTDFGNPPIAQNGIHFADALNNAKQNLAKSTQEPEPEKESTLTSILNAGKQLGGMLSEASSEEMRRGGYLPMAQEGGIFNIANAIGGAFTTPGKAATATSPATAASGGLGDTMMSMFGKDPGAFGKANPAGAFGKGGVGTGAGNFGKGMASGAGAAGIGLLNAAPQILEGIGQIGEQKKAIKKADQMSQISGVTAQAAESRDISKPKNKYVRPEDQMIQGLNPQGSGTNFLAAYGASIGGNPTEIQNTYNPGDLYSDLGYEPLNDSNVKQFAHGGNLHRAEFGEYFQNSGQASIGKGVGSAIGSAFFGPVGGKVGEFVGGVAGNLLGGVKDARQLKGFEDTTKANTERAAVQSTAQGLQSTYSSSMEDGGWVSNEWQPQVIATFGEHKVSDLLKPPYDADMLRSGGHLAQIEYTPPSAEAMFTGRRDMPYQMEYGGQMAMGGDLEVHRGKAEPISYNPFLPDGGETIMFKGPSHDNGGMPISYGQNGVEVEGGEPAVKLADGGSPDGNLVVFGNMKIDDMAANHIGVEASKGKKYKRFIDDLSKFESKQNKVVSKGTELVNDSNTNDPFDQLAMNSGRAMMMGGNAKLLNAAIIKQRAAGVQNAILDTAKEYGVKSDELAQGKFVKDKNSDMAKYGAKMETAQNGSIVDYLKGVGKKADFSSRKALAKDMGIKNYKGTAKQNMEMLEGLNTKTNNASIPARMNTFNNALPIGENIVANALGPNYNPYATTIPYQQGYSDSNLPEVTVSGSRKKQPVEWPDLPGVFSKDQIAKGDDKQKFDWKGLAEGVASNLVPFFRPSNQEGLDPNQLMPEYFSLASNQLEPVNAQQYSPRLKDTYNISLQDQLNEVDSQVRAATKQIGNNPAAAAQIFAQAADAKNKIRGEQFRMNQANQVGTQNANIDTLNQAQMQNLQLLDQQYVRQSQAKSNTKAQTLEALKSIAAKTAQNKLENRQLGIMENMYNFRFGPNGQAYNVNGPAAINMSGTGTGTGTTALPEGFEYTYRKDASGKLVPDDIKKKAKTGKSGITLNGSIVKALKTL
jgi:hypothetical protein